MQSFEINTVLAQREQAGDAWLEFLRVPELSVGVYHVKGSFYAIANHCPHEGGPLCEGRQGGRTIVDDDAVGGASIVQDGECVYCPWHQWGISLATGTPRSLPAAREHGQP